MLHGSCVETVTNIKVTNLGNDSNRKIQDLTKLVGSYVAFTLT